MFSAQVQVIDPLGVIGNFVEFVRGEAMAEAELQLVTSGLYDLQNDETAA
jgi:hypothetical protein